MKKIVRQSGPHSSEGAIVGLEALGESSKSCNNGYMVRKRCNDLKKTFFGNFRTIEGECNNEENPSLEAPDQHYLDCYQPNISSLINRHISKSLKVHSFKAIFC